MKRSTNVSKEQPVDRVVAEETTTLPEGAVLSVYRIRVGKLGHQSTRLVALHANKRVEMGVDNISPQNLRQYLGLVRRHIERLRKDIEVKPELDPLCGGKPNNIKQFVLGMAYNGMFIFDVLNNEPQDSDADNHKTTTKVVEGSSSTEALPQVRANHNGAMHGSRKAKANRRRTKQ